MATTDELTGLLSRREIMRILEVEIARVSRQSTPLSIMMLDLDHFKSINDNFGHQVGDATLKTAADSFSIFLRKTDFIGRIGGEEFLIVLPDTKLNDAYELAERIRLVLEKHTVQAPSVPACTASIGIAQCQPADNLNSLILRADEALYQAKSKGRNCVVGEL